MLPDLVERKVLLDVVGRNEATRGGGERSSSVGRGKVFVCEGIHVLVRRGGGEEEEQEEQEQEQEHWKKAAYPWWKRKVATVSVAFSPSLLNCSYVSPSMSVFCCRYPSAPARSCTTFKISSLFSGRMS